MTLELNRKASKACDYLGRVLGREQSTKAIKWDCVNKEAGVEAEVRGRRR